MQRLPDVRAVIRVHRGGSDVVRFNPLTDHRDELLRVQCRSFEQRTGDGFHALPHGRLS